jgi:hypothetical protein
MEVWSVVGLEPRGLDWEVLTKLIESKPEVEKLLIARGWRPRLAEIE